MITPEELKGKYFPVLDQGFIALIDYMGGDKAVDQAARISYGTDSRKISARRGLIRYLMRHRHTSPFEMCELKFHCAMPIFVARQWVRHRTASLNEFSGRYSEVPEVFYTPSKDSFQLQSKHNHQGRDEKNLASGYPYHNSLWLTGRYELAWHYNELLKEGVSRELARIDLPQSTYTQWYWKIDLHNLFHFLTLRTDSHAQWEIRQFANVIAGMVKIVAPLSYEAWLDYHVNGCSLSNGELQAIQNLMCVRDDQIAVRIRGYSGCIQNDELEEDFGLGPREIEELKDKLRWNSHSDFTLDIGQAKDADHFKNIHTVTKEE